jgi:hypothetical protein
MYAMTSSRAVYADCAQTTERTRAAICVGARGPLLRGKGFGRLRRRRRPGRRTDGTGRLQDCSRLAAGREGLEPSPSPSPRPPSAQHAIRVYVRGLVDPSSCGSRIARSVPPGGRQKTSDSSKNRERTGVRAEVPASLSVGTSGGFCSLGAGRQRRVAPRLRRPPWCLVRRNGTRRAFAARHASQLSFECIEKQSRIRFARCHSG